MPEFSNVLLAAEATIARQKAIISALEAEKSALFAKAAECLAAGNWERLREMLEEREPPCPNSA